MWNDDQRWECERGKFSPRVYARVMIFYVIATIIYICCAYYFTLPFHFMSVICECVYVCGVHVKWEASNTLNAKERNFYSIVTNVRVLKALDVRVCVYERERWIRQGIWHFKSNLSCSNIYIVFDGCRNGNGLIHFGIWSHRYCVCMILCVIYFVFAARLPFVNRGIAISGRGEKRAIIIIHTVINRIFEVADWAEKYRKISVDIKYIDSIKSTETHRPQTWKRNFFSNKICTCMLIWIRPSRKISKHDTTS